MLEQLTRYWWVLAIRGVAAVLFGIGAFAWPGITLTVLIIWWGAYALVDGVFAIGSAIRQRRENNRWWATLIEGIIGVLAGLVAWIMPGMTAFVLVLVIAGWAIGTGVFEIVAAIRLRKEIAGEWLLGLSGVLSIAMGILIFIAPGPGALAMIWLIGTYAIVFGVVMIALAFRLRGRADRELPKPAAPPGVMPGREVPA